MEPPRDINVAVGILSTLSSFSRRALSTAAHSSMRRNLIRNTTRGLHAPDVALRFLVAAPAADRRRGVGDYASRFRSEQMAHGDLLLLNMTEHFLLCPLKYLLWLRIAPSLFPSAVWIASGDDDVYLQLEHLSAELHLVATLTNANEQPVLWGLITWKAFMNSHNCVCGGRPRHLYLCTLCHRFPCIMIALIRLSFIALLPPPCEACLNPRSCLFAISSPRFMSESLLDLATTQTILRWASLGGPTVTKWQSRADAVRSAASPTREASLPPPPKQRRPESQRPIWST